MKTIFVMLALLVVPQEPQKISATYESYIPEGWVAWDQFGTHGMGETREEAIADCKRTYEARLKRLGIKMTQTETDEITGKWLRQNGFKYHAIRKYYYFNTFNDTLLIHSHTDGDWSLSVVADHIDPAEHNKFSAMLTGKATREDVLRVLVICDRERNEED